MQVCLHQFIFIIYRLIWAYSCGWSCAIVQVIYRWFTGDRTGDLFIIIIKYLWICFSEY